MRTRRAQPLATLASGLWVLLLSPQGAAVRMERNDSTATPSIWVSALDDSVVYRLISASHLQVKTGKAGLFGFAGHEHVIEARGFSGTVVLYPRNQASSHVEITVPTESLRVLSPPDTAEIRKVTAAMRSDVLHTSQYPE